MPDLDDMTIEEIRKELARLRGNSRELDEVRAILAVNCRRGQQLHELGIYYDNQKSVLSNVVRVLNKLMREIEVLTAYENPTKSKELKDGNKRPELI